MHKRENVWMRPKLVAGVEGRCHVDAAYTPIGCVTMCCAMVCVMPRFGGGRRGIPLTLLADADMIGDRSSGLRSIEGILSPLPFILYHHQWIASIYTTFSSR